MKQIKKIELDILDTLMKIHNRFPELSKYIAEMPQNYTGKDEMPMSEKKLKENYNSLDELLIEYAKTHTAILEK